MSKIEIKRKNPKASERILTNFKKLVDLEVAQGWTDEQDPADVTIAAINYFGAPAAKIPPRDALTPASEKTREAARNVTVSAGQAANRGTISEQDLQPLADGAGAQLRNEIRALKTPPNAKSTVAKKGFDNPLIGRGDGGRILTSAGAVVRERT